MSIPLNELLQVDATVIAGVLVLLLVTKFLDRNMHPKDDLLTAPRKMVGVVIPLFALSALFILLPDTFDTGAYLLSIGLAHMLTLLGFIALIVSVLAVALTPNTRIDKSIQGKKSVLDSIKSIFCHSHRKNNNVFSNDSNLDPNRYHDG